MEYKVTWELDVTASNPRAAAKYAFEFNAGKKHSGFKIQEIGSDKVWFIDPTEEQTISINAVRSETISYFDCPECHGATEIACSPMQGWRVCCGECGASFVLT